MNIDLNLEHLPPLPRQRHIRIGAIGAGFIMRDIHLVAYKNAGFNVVAITSKDLDQARATAELRGVPKVHNNWQDLMADEQIEVLDIAVPPHAQPEIVHAALRHRHIRGILAQKPVATNYRDAQEMVRACESAGVRFCVNQNMRYDHSIRALKTVLRRGYLGEPVLGTIDMRAIPHWQPWAKDYNQVTLIFMSIHHLDSFRYLFGDPEFVYASARQDPRTEFPHRDGIVLYILEYANGLRAAAWDDVWAGPAREGGASDIYIKWRVEGTAGMAEGTIGWPGYPARVPSTIRFTTNQQPDCWLSPTWPQVWFPDAFEGTMGELLCSLEEGRESVLSGRDNLNTMALVEACYRSLDQHRPVRPAEIKEGTGMKLGLINSAWLGSPVGTEEGIHKTREIGFDTIDIFADPLDTDIKERRLIKDTCRAAGLPVVSVCCCALGIADFNPAVRRFHVERAKEHLDLVYELEARNLLLVLGEYIWQQEVITPRDQWNWAVETVQELGDYAAGLGVEIAIELEPFQLSIVNTLAKMVTYLNDVNHPAVRANLDISHLSLAHTPAEDIANLQGRIAHAHFSDCDGKKHGDLPPGRGVVDFRPYLAALKKTGFNGVVSIELEYSPEPDKIVDWVTEAYRETNKLMQEIGIRG